MWVPSYLVARECYQYILPFCDLTLDVVGAYAYRVPKTRGRTLESYTVGFRSHICHMTYMTLGNTHYLSRKKPVFSPCNLIYKIVAKIRVVKMCTKA